MLHSVNYNDDGEPAAQPPKFSHCFFERLTLTGEMLDHDRTRHEVAPIEISGFEKAGFETEDIVFKDITIQKAVRDAAAGPLPRRNAGQYCLCPGLTL